jgi:hypothetical protein
MRFLKKSRNRERTVVFQSSLYKVRSSKTVWSFGKYPVINNPKSLFTPLESPNIYGGDVERKCSFVIEGGVKAPSFLTGFTS